MDKLKMHSLDVVGSNIKKIQQLFPNCVTERLGKDGKPELAIDFDKLKAELSNEIIGEGEERYQFTWPDKRVANRLANTPTTMTLRPCRGESVDFDHTQNLYIEGDNLDVLKVLRETYLGKVKMIYIDPPYNTGNDFVYNDDFAQSRNEFEETSGLFDEEGNQTIDPMQRNTESNGRFHTDWLNMIYPRLKVARDLLTDDGVIFISIDDNEVENLKKICNEIFGAYNFQGHIHWRRRHNQPNDKTKMIGIVAEHILAYSKDCEYLRKVGVGKIELTANFTNPDNDPRGPWASKPWKVGSDQSGSRYTIVAPNGVVYNEEWMGEQETFEALLKDNRIIFTKNGEGLPRKKYFKYERQEEGQCATNWWNHELFGHNQGANDCLTELFGIKNIFSNPKPIELMRGLLQIGNVKNDDIVLDFFSGSSSLAHAVIKMNNDDQVNIKFIMIQITEDLDESYKTADSKTKKKIEQAIRFLDSIGKSHTIPEIAKERIRRAGEKIKMENADMERAIDIDTGFRVLKLDSSNMNDVYYTPEEFGLNTLFSENVKSDRTAEDLLFQVMLDLGIELSAKIEKQLIAGKEVFLVDQNYLIACFDEDVNETTITEIAKMKPVYFVMRDASAANDNVIDNFEQLFEAYSKDTVRKIL